MISAHLVCGLPLKRRQLFSEGLKSVMILQGCLVGGEVGGRTTSKNEFLLE